MAEKKAPYRFTIGFNPGDPTHRQVVELLNQQGHRKAQFLVNAVLHYVHCPETPDIPEMDAGMPVMGEKDMETLIVRILKDRGYFKDMPDEVATTVAVSDSPAAKSGKELGSADMAAIADTLAAFRGI